MDNNRPLNNITDINRRREIAPAVVAFIRDHYSNEYFDLLSVITNEDKQTNEALTLGFIAGARYILEKERPPPTEDENAPG